MPTSLQNAPMRNRHLLLSDQKSTQQDSMPPGLGGDDWIGELDDNSDGFEEMGFN
jgi:hypothetical protein